MNDAQFDYTQATTADLSDIIALLTATQLPFEGVADYITGFLVARNSSGQAIGCIGLERHGNIGLLRSAAIAPAFQGTGLGTYLTRVLLERATQAGIQEVVLLTTTAKDFFIKRFGFQVANRADYDKQLAESPEWLLPRCSSAIFLRLTLE
jgi:amino-acid N-acetyltransferase